MRITIFFHHKYFSLLLFECFKNNTNNTTLAKVLGIPLKIPTLIHQIPPVD